MGITKEILMTLKKHQRKEQNYVWTVCNDWKKTFE